ncbi:ras-related protein rab-30 [Anaeramoeba ignava]|uniref:Ras-related protein rab-30 n=1 Tax=Anaeramoeba ignava TaxID=1746090 RepID=A0A9Q0LS86_ANAIG|nr:ras-related protein rab-30 [Anaeramoeba ignava]
MSFDYLFKVIIIGSANVGKTSLINRYVDNTFNFEKEPTIGVDFKTKDIEIDNQTIRLQIWDTAGQERFRNSFLPSIYKNADIVLIVFDITNENSLKEIGDYLKEIENSHIQDPLIVIVGNKSDLIENKIENLKEKLENILKNEPFRFFKTSAKNGKNVDELFYETAKEFKQNQPKHHLNKNINSFDLQNERNQQSKIISLENEQENRTKQKCC